MPDTDDEVEVPKATLAALRPENVARPLMSRGFPATGDGNPDLATKESTSPAPKAVASSAESPVAAATLAKGMVFAAAAPVLPQPVASEPVAPKESHSPDVKAALVSSLVTGSAAPPVPLPNPGNGAARAQAAPASDAPVPSETDVDLRITVNPQVSCLNLFADVYKP